MLIKRQYEMQELAGNLRDEIREMEKDHFSTALNDFAFQELKNRMKGLPLRAFFVKKSYQLLQSKSTKKNLTSSSSLQEELSVKLPFVFEVIITIQYLHNQILDQKAGVTTPENINKNLLTGNLLKDFLYQYIEDNFSKKTAPLVTQTTRKAFQYVDIGQYIEKEWNTLEQFERSHELSSISISKEVDDFIDFKGMETFLDAIYKHLPLEHHVFTETYLKRIYLTCAALFKLAGDLISDLLQVDQKTKEDFSSFAASYGLMRQIINDNADVVPSSHQLQTQHRTADDAFSDWNNKNITLPFIHLLSEDNKLTKRYSTPLKKEQQATLFQELLSSNALFRSIHQARLLSAIAKSKLPFSGEDAALLLDTCEIANWNKFLAPCLKTKAYSAFKKTTAYGYSKKLIRSIECPIPATIEAHKESESWQLDVGNLFPAFS